MSTAERELSTALDWTHLSSGIWRARHGDFQLLVWDRANEWRYRVELLAHGNSLELMWGGEPIDDSGEHARLSAERSLCEWLTSHAMQEQP